MANKKITDLTELTEAASDDYLEIVDTSANTSKKISYGNLIAGHRVAGMVYFNPPSTHPDYTSATFETGTYTVNVNTKFGVPLGATGVIVFMGAQWDEAAGTSVMALRAKGDNANCVVSRALVGRMNINSSGSVPINESGEFDLYFGGEAPKNKSVVVNIVGYVI
jgi:hypothetical protein